MLTSELVVPLSWLRFEVELEGEAREECGKGTNQRSDERKTMNLNGRARQMYTFEPGVCTLIFCMHTAKHQDNLGQTEGGSYLPQQMKLCA